MQVLLRFDQEDRLIIQRALAETESFLLARAPGRLAAWWRGKNHELGKKL
jgi:hypothetical protein